MLKSNISTLDKKKNISNPFHSNKLAEQKIRTKSMSCKYVELEKNFGIKFKLTEEQEELVAHIKNCITRDYCAATCVGLLAYLLNLISFLFPHIFCCVQPQDYVNNKVGSNSTIFHAFILTCWVIFLLVCVCADDCVDSAHLNQTPVVWKQVVLGKAASFDVATHMRTPLSACAVGG